MVTRTTQQSFEELFRRRPGHVSQTEEELSKLHVNHRAEYGSGDRRGRASRRRLEHPDQYRVFVQSLIHLCKSAAPGRDAPRRDPPRRGSSMRYLATIALIIAANIAWAANFAWAADAVDYARDIAPLLQRYCVGCHTADDPEGGLVMESHDQLMSGGASGVAITGGSPASSRMMLMITGSLIRSCRRKVKNDHPNPKSKPLPPGSNRERPVRTVKWWSGESCEPRKSSLHRE